MRLSLVVGLVVCCCGNIDKMNAPDAPPGIDVPPAPDAPVDSQLPAFSAPVPIAEVDTTSSERGPTLTGDLLELYFVSDRAGGLGGADIWCAKRASTTAAWDPPVLVPNVNSADGEGHPFVTRDGLQLYFSVAHAGTTTGLDIYVSVRADRGSAWSPPTAVTELNSLADDVAIGISADGLELALDSSRGGASGRDLYLSKRANATQPWGIPVGISELNDATTQKLPQLADDGRAIWFVQTTTSNGDDIMVATRPALDAPFGTPTAVSELNSATAEDDPWISNDQRTIVFASSRNGNFDLFIATR